MTKIDMLDKLDKAIRDSDISLKAIQANVEKIDKEIDILSLRKTELEKNIEFHKKQYVVPIAHEYKKSKVELSNIKTRLNLIVEDKKKSENACKDIEKILEKFRKDYSDLAKTSDKNVLRPNFGGTRGKK